MENHTMYASVNPLERHMPAKARNFDHVIGERLGRLRGHAGLTLDQLAKRSGVSRAMIARIERAESNATVLPLERLCDALGIS